jgi:hypothetical protein
MTRLKKVHKWLSPEPVRSDAWFPGPVIGGLALIAGPVLWCVGLLLRYLPNRMGLIPADRVADLDAQMFAAPTELAMYAANPALVATGYAVFLLGAAVLFATYATLGRIAAVASPRLALWGAALLILSLFARFFHAGAETTAFQLVDLQGADAATAFVLQSYQTIAYGPWRIPVWCSAGQFLGVVLLTVAAYRARFFGLAQCAAMIWGGWLWAGVLKESHLMDVIASAAVCAVLVPLGIRLLRGRGARLDLAPGRTEGFRWY